MRMFDTTPLLRSTVGFDNINRLLDSVTRQDPRESAYPPYNIEKVGDDSYRISMAVAGFKESELNIVVSDGVLEVSGKSETAEESPESTPTFLHRGIAKRAFNRRFTLADTIKVRGAGLEDGLLHVELEREIPEERRPRQIQINGGSQAVIDSKAA
ncbi:MAG: Hsp20 family protein [Alphaproteobacteria bacterium]|nr:MAG: Hsp20 family protein [Alphaproteobacteria bacterium]